MQPDKEFRWDYDYVELGDPQDTSYSMLDIYEEFQPTSDSDDWASGSSSSYSTGGRSPSNGTRSPTEDSQSLWDGETVGSDIETLR
jgi:inositol phosphorylceramide synthase catalytic subunit